MRTSRNLVNGSGVKLWIHDFDFYSNEICNLILIHMYSYALSLCIGNLKLDFEALNMSTRGRNYAKISDFWCRSAARAAA